MVTYPIVIICGSRADAGLLTPVITTALATPTLDPVVLTLNRSWLPTPTIPRTRVCQLEPSGNGDTPPDIARAMGHYLTRFAFYLDNIRPSMVVVLGDRWEVLAATIAAHLARIPIAHIHGGEETAGSYDNAMRHAITHMATLHFVAHDNAHDRVRELIGWIPPFSGLVAPSHIHDTGALGTDGLTPYHGERQGYIVAYYPETATPNPAHQSAILSNIWEAIRRHHPDSRDVLWISPNLDVGSTGLSVSGYRLTTMYLPSADFLDHLRSARAIIGNSSAGIIEAPALGTPTINIGTRQSGRLMSGSIRQSDGTLTDLTAALEWADRFTAASTPYKRWYTGTNVAHSIITHITNYLTTTTTTKEAPTHG